MERYIYLSYCAVEYEGSNLCGIHTSFEAAKAKAEEVFQEAINEHREIGCEPVTYAQGLSFHVNFYDTEKQEYVYSWYFDQEKREWESQASCEIRNVKEDWAATHVRS